MPYNESLIGTTSRPIETVVDTRRLMAYAAGLGDYSPHYLDTQNMAPVIAHPLFPVCLEWPCLLDMAERELECGVTGDEHARAVHTYHDLQLYRPIYAGDSLTTQVTVVGLEQRKSGILQSLRLDTHDASGELVCQTFQQSIVRGTELDGQSHCREEPPAAPVFARVAEVQQSFKMRFHPGMAHVYTECSGIWNAIHTDRSVAQAAGLPDIILHGSATLAFAISKLIEQYLDGDPRRVVRVGGRFSAMVTLPCTAEIVVYQVGRDRASFSVFNADKQQAIRDGFIYWQ